MKHDYIQVYGPPEAAFTASPRSGKGPLSVDFTDLSDTGGPPITSWYWSFGDGSTSTQQNPSHTYTSVGTYTVSLTVSTTVGDDVTTDRDFIEVLENQPPDVRIQSRPDHLDPNTTPEFTWSGSDSDGYVDHYLIGIDIEPWLRIDSTSHVFSELLDGEHTFAICAVDNDGLRSDTRYDDFVIVKEVITTLGDVLYSYTDTIDPDDGWTLITIYSMNKDLLRITADGEMHGIAIPFRFNSVTRGEKIRVQTEPGKSSVAPSTLSYPVWKGRIEAKSWKTDNPESAYWWSEFYFTIRDSLPYTTLYKWGGESPIEDAVNSLWFLEWQASNYDYFGGRFVLEIEANSLGDDWGQVESSDVSVLLVMVDSALTVGNVFWEVYEKLDNLDSVLGVINLF